MMLCYANKPVARGIVAPVSVRDAFGNKVGIVNVLNNESEILNKKRKHLGICRNRLEGKNKVKRVGRYIVRLAKFDNGSRLDFVRLFIVAVY